MKLLTAAVAAAVLLLSAGTVWIGTRVREDTVVPHPYEQGLAYDEQRRGVGHAGHGHGRAGALSGECDLGAGACARALGDLELTLDVTPRPPRAMRELAVRGHLVRQGEPVEGAQVRVSFAMAGMSMGENVAQLAGAGDGDYRGKAILVRCRSGRRDWVATAVVQQGGEERRADFPLRLGE